MDVREASAGYAGLTELPGDAVPLGYKRTEVGVIPEDWRVATLDALAHSIRRGASPRPIDDPVWFDEASKVGWVRISDVTQSGRYLVETTQHLSQQGIRHSRYLPYGALIMSICATVGRPIETRIDVCIHDGFVVFERPVVAQDFLYHVLKDLEQEWSGKGQTGSQMNLNTGLIKSTLVPIPPTAIEQKTIAEALSDADALIESLEQLIAKKRQIKQGTMQALLTGKQRLPGFAGDWAVKRLGDVLEFQVGHPFSSAFFNEKEQGVRIVKNRDLKSDDQIFHYSSQYDLAFQVNDGDVLVGMDGDFLPCRWSKGPALLNQRVGRAIPLNGLDRAFAFYYLLEPLKDIEMVTSSTTVKHLSHGDVEGIENPLPSIPEQTAIAAILTDMDAELSVLETRLARTRQLKQGMMQELLTGRIRLI